jgi:peptide/nickel transport system substrate-binding protein
MPPAVIGRRGGALSYRTPTPPTTFNYLAPSDDVSIIVALYLLGGRLVEFDHASLRYVPSLAESWARAGDGRTVEVTLRDGIHFSDGRPITAEDVAFTLRAMYDGRVASPIFRSAMTIGGRQIDAEVVDARRLRLRFPDVVAAPETYLSNVAVLPRHTLEAALDRGAFREAYGLNADPQTIVTSGAFAVESSTPGAQVTLKRNPHYWKKDKEGTQLPYLDRLVIDVVSDANNAFIRLQQGSLDVYDRMRPADYASLLSQPGAARAVDLGPGLQTDHFWFNLHEGARNGKPVANPVKRAWFADTRFRQAVSRAMDRRTLAASTLQGLATPLYGFVSPGNRAWVAADLPRVEYDLDRARALLREAGFRSRGPQDRPELVDAKGNRVEFTLIVPTESSARKQIATVLQENLARLGVNMQVAPIEFGEFQRRTMQSFEYDAALLGTSLTEPDPSSYVNFLQSGGAMNPWRPDEREPLSLAWEARVNELLAAQARETDSARRHAAFDKIQHVLVEQLPVIPIVTRHLVTAANSRVGNFRPSPILPFALWNAEELFIKEK